MRIAQERVHRCAAQGCSRLEGHDGNHWCSVCNARDLAGVAFFEHECEPDNEPRRLPRDFWDKDMTERECLAALGYCPDCRDLAHDGACIR